MNILGLLKLVNPWIILAVLAAVISWGELRAYQARGGERVKWEAAIAAQKVEAAAVLAKFNEDKRKKELADEEATRVVNATYAAEIAKLERGHASYAGELERRVRFWEGRWRSRAAGLPGSSADPGGPAGASGGGDVGLQGLDPRSLSRAAYGATKLAEIVKVCVAWAPSAGRL